MSIMLVQVTVTSIYFGIIDRKFTIRLRGLQATRAD